MCWSTYCASAGKQRKRKVVAAVCAVDMAVETGDALVRRIDIDMERKALPENNSATPVLLVSCAPNC